MNAETSSLRILKIMSRNINEIVRSWIGLLVALAKKAMTHLFSCLFFLPSRPYTLFWQDMLTEFLKADKRCFYISSKFVCMWPRIHIHISCTFQMSNPPSYIFSDSVKINIYIATYCICSYIQIHPVCICVQNVIRLRNVYSSI